MESEIWMPCEGINYPLEVSSHGRVRSLDRIATVSSRSRNGKPQATHIQRRPGKILSQCTTKSGYLEVALMVDGKRRKYSVHRLVGMAYVDGYFEGASIDHLDGNKKNNLPSNLEWVTLSENTKRQWATGLVDLRGELAPGAKITNTQAHAIFVLVENGFMVSQISDWFGVSTSCIYKIRDGKRHISNIGRDSCRTAVRAQAQPFELADQRQAGI